MEIECLGELDAGADERTDHLDALEDSLEDRQVHDVVGRQANQDKCAVSLQAREGLFARLWGGGKHDRGIGTTERLYRLGGVVGRSVHYILRTKFLGDVEFAVDKIDGATVAPAMRAYCTAMWPRPPMPNTATKSDDRAPETFTAL